MMPGLNETAVVRIPYVKVYTDRHGRVRRYFRKRGSKAVTLPGVPGSAEFMAAYQEAIGAPAPVSISRQHRPNSVGALITDYLKSAAFQTLKPSSQHGYRIVLDRFGVAHGHRMVHDMPRAKVAAYIHEIGSSRPGMGNLTRKVLRRLLAYAVRLGYRNDNPITEIDSYRLGTRHTWSETELAAFERRWHLGTRERLAYALLLHTAQRCGDVVRMRRATCPAALSLSCSRKPASPCRSRSILSLWRRSRPARAMASILSARLAGAPSVHRPSQN
jgi:hypothetical protein